MNDHDPFSPDDAQPTRVWNPLLRRHAVHLKPGEFHLARPDETLIAVVGFGVSTCVRDPVTGFGGMNYFILPEEEAEPSDDWRQTAANSAMRFGNLAMEHLITAICKNGARREHLEIMVFGANCPTRDCGEQAERHEAFLRAYLAAEGMRPTIAHLGGDKAQEVVYTAAGGVAQVTRLSADSAQLLLAQELAFLVSLRKLPEEAGEVELF